MTSTRGGPDIRLALATDDLIDSYLIAIENRVSVLGISRAELASRMNMKVATVDQIFGRTRALTFKIAVSMAFHLQLSLKMKLTSHTKAHNDLFKKAMADK